MFVLRPSHRTAFHEVALEDFEHRALAGLRTEFPDREAELRGQSGHAFFRETVRTAGAMGLTSEQAVIAWAVIRLTLPTGFETDPNWDWVPEMLQDTSFDQNFRAPRAVEHVREILESSTGGG